MSAGTEEFTTPDVEAADYYTRLGAPDGADAAEIEQQTKKYVREFMPQDSTHERAQERWNRFKQARNTLRSPDDKEHYDTFRERFGPERGTEAFETWEARNRPDDPSSLDPAKVLGMPPEGEDTRETTTDETRRDQQQRTQRQQTEDTQSRFENRRRTAETQRHRDADLDVDLDSTKTHSTRSPDADRQEDDGTAEEATEFDRLVDHARTTTALVVQETTTVLSMMELIVAAYVVYAVVVQFVTPAVASVAGGVVLQDLVTVGATLGLGYGLAGQYLRRFAGERPDVALDVGLDVDLDADLDVLDTGESGPSPGRRILERTDRPEAMLLVPVAAAALFGVGFLLGGGALSLFLFGVALLSVYARARVVADILSTPDWNRYAEPIGGVAVGALFLTTFVVTDASVGTGVSDVMSGGTAVVAILAVATALAVAAPTLPVVATLRAD